MRLTVVLLVAFASLRAVPVAAQDTSFRRAEAAEARGDVVAAYQMATEVMTRVDALPEAGRARLRALHERLAAQVTELVVRVAAPDARVLVDDQTIEAGEAVLVTRGAHRIRSEAPGHLPLSRYVVLSAAKVALTLTLPAAGDAAALPSPPPSPSARGRSVGLGVLALVGAVAAVATGARNAATPDCTPFRLGTQPPARHRRRPTLGEERRERRQARRDWRRRREAALASR